MLPCLITLPGGATILLCGLPTAPCSLLVIVCAGNRCKLIEP